MSVVPSVCLCILGDYHDERISLIDDTKDKCGNDCVNDRDEIIERDIL